MDVSIILVNYKTAELTLNAINSIIEKTKNIKYEIIVVDNSNNSNEFSKLTNIIGDKAKVINANDNLGFGKGNNLGVSNSNGDYILFINTDTLLINNAIFELYNFIKNHNDVGIVGPNMYTKDMKPNHSYINYEKNLKNELKQNTVLSIIRRKLFKRQDFNFSNKPKDIAGYICGACLMIKKEYFEKIGGFDKDIFMYAEDALLCYQVMNTLHKKLYNIPSAKIIHFEGESSDKNRNISYNHAKMIVDGNTVFYNKIYGINKTKKYLSSMIKVHRKKSILARLIFKKTKYNNYKNIENAYNEKIKELKN